MNEGFKKYMIGCIKDLYVQSSPKAYGEYLASKGKRKKKKKRRLR